MSNDLIPKHEWPRVKDIESFLGRMEIGSDGLPTDRWKRVNLTTASVPFHFRMAWDHQITVRRVTCHRAVRTSLETIFEQIYNAFDKDWEKIKEARADILGNCYSFQRKGHKLSMHAYGAAITIDPEFNPVGDKWRPNTGMIHPIVIEAFKAQGWSWGGDRKNMCDPATFEAVTR